MSLPLSKSRAIVGVRAATAAELERGHDPSGRGHDRDE
jgi:hypothetical protein